MSSTKTKPRKRGPSRLVKKLRAELKGSDQTIQLLARQLADKKEIIRKLVA